MSNGFDYRENFGEDGLFYCQNISKLADREKGFLEGRAVLSTLQYAIRENGTFYGLVGFDDCGIRRFWTREQIEALTFTGKLLSVFLLKYRTQDA